MLTKQKLKYYFNNGFSLREIGEKHNCSKDTIKKLAKDLGLKTPSYRKSIKNPKRAQRMKETCLIRYGVDNPCKVPEIRKKIYKACEEKYGTKTPIVLFSKLSPNNKSSFQDKIEDFLKTKKIPFKTEQAIFSRYNRALKREYSPRVDILIEDKKLIIECFGDYWHANPKIFKRNEKIYKFKGPVVAHKIWNFDRIRKNHIKSFGYSVIIIWEGDFNSDPQKTCKALLDRINKTNV